MPIPSDDGSIRSEPVPVPRSRLSRSRPRLLVSVRSEFEVELAIEAGAEIVDLKEPLAGALAPTARAFWDQTARRWEAMDRSVPRPLLSAALGEPQEATSLAGSLPATFDFAKAGPSGCDAPTRLRQTWADVRDQLDPGIELVGVAYADWQRAGCVSPSVVLELAAEFGLRHCLLDTFHKDGRSSLEQLGIESLRSLAKQANRLGLWWALAGSIRSQDVARLRSLEVVPDCLGVRGDVCQGSREGILQADRVRNWLQQLEQFSK